MEFDKANHPNQQNPTGTELNEDELEQVVGGADFKKKGEDLVGIGYEKYSPVEFVTNPASLNGNFLRPGVDQKV